MTVTNTTNSAIVGGWNYGSGVVTFLQNGTYFLAEVHHEQGNAFDNANTPSGIEFGTYSWDSSTGKLSGVPLVDTNGLAGFSSPTDAETQEEIQTKMTVSDNTALFGGEMMAQRITSSTNPIVGSWYKAENNIVTKDDIARSKSVLTFLADGTYFMADDGDSNADPSGQDGMEKGTYSWDVNSGAFSAETLVDTTGEWGLSDTTFPKQVTIFGDKISINGIQLATRVGGLINESPVVDPVHVNHLPTGNVTISGAVKQAETLTATNTLVDEDGLGVINYQWLSNNIAISGETKNSHTLTAADVGKTISAKASYTDAFGTAESMNSQPTTAVQKLVVITPKPVISTKQTDGNDSITGTNGNDTLDGGLGKDTLTGGNGNDLYIIDNAGDKIIEVLFSGIDTVLSKISYTLRGSLENLGLLGSANINAMGNELNNALSGNDGKNLLNGMAGNDAMSGGKGSDKLIGGTGADIFKLNNVDESGITSATRDTITDFKHSEGDKIDLSAIDTNAKLASDQAFTFIGNQAFSKTDATGQLRFDATAHVLYGSTNADNKPEFSILLSGIKALAFDDFVL